MVGKTARFLFTIFLFCNTALADFDLGGNYRCSADNKITLKGKPKTLKAAQAPIKNKIADNSNKIISLKNKKNSQAKVKTLKDKNSALRVILKNLSDCSKGRISTSVGDQSVNPLWQNIVGSWAKGSFDFDYASSGEMKFFGPIDMTVSLDGPILNILVNFGGGFPAKFAGLSQFNIALDVRQSVFKDDSFTLTSEPTEFFNTPFGRLQVSLTGIRNLATNVVDQYDFNLRAFDYPTGEFFNLYRPLSFICTVTTRLDPANKEIFANFVMQTPLQAELRSASIYFRRD